MNWPQALAILLLTVSHLPAATLYVSLGNTTPMPPYTNWLTAATNIQDAVNVAGAGDTVLVTNGVYAQGGLRLPDGDLSWWNRVAVTNRVALKSVNGPEFTVIDGLGMDRCVILADGASLTGFTLSNGYCQSYGAGVWSTSTNGFLTNCTLVGNLVPTLQAVGGGARGCTLYDCTLSGNWAYDGGGAESCTLYNCTLSGNRAIAGGGAGSCTLYNCTLSNNSAAYCGGGAFESFLYNCILKGNSAPSYAGGGASVCYLYNSLLSSNSAIYGGGAESSCLYNCTLTGNSASNGGGVCYWAGGYNCIMYFNTATNGANYDFYSTLNYCCTTPLPTYGIGNITNEPLFLDYPGGNVRLQSNSPCMNAGNNAYVTTATDLDGNQRIVRGTVDIGAYEHQGAGSVISYAWLQQYGLLIDGSADYTDPDHDGMNNWQEWRCQTDPTNALSVLRLVSALPTGTNVVVTWQSVAGVNYYLERSTNLSRPFTPRGTNLIGQAVTTTFTDTNAASLAPLFYRVGVGF